MKSPSYLIIYWLVDTVDASPQKGISFLVRFELILLYFSSSFNGRETWSLKALEKNAVKCQDVSTAVGVRRLKDFFWGIFLAFRDEHRSLAADVSLCWQEYVPWLILRTSIAIVMQLLSVDELLTIRSSFHRPGLSPPWKLNYCPIITRYNGNRIEFSDIIYWIIIKLEYDTMIIESSLALFEIIWGQKSVT